MTVQTWLMYLTLVLVATSTPGPAVLFVVTNATLYGRRIAFFSALGNITGLFLLGVLAVTGLGAIIKTSELIFNGIKYAGAAYLVYMGLRLFHAKGLQLNAFQDQVMTSQVPSRSIYFQAVGVAVSNPKAIVFLTALFPQFLNINSPLVPQFLMLIITLMTFSFLFLMSYALMAHKAKTWLFRADRVRAVSRLSGTVFIGFGILLATSSNK